MMAPKRPDRLEEPYRSRAAPAGSARYWSWLFAHADARDALIGAYALLAEWRALMNPRTERPVAETKIRWWHEEMQRLAQRRPLHPISRFLAELPGADTVDFEPLTGAAEAAARQIGGVAVERHAELSAHAYALLGYPLWVAAQFVARRQNAAGLQQCLRALSLGEYLARAIAEYRQAALVGRMLFPIDALLAAGIDNDDLIARTPPARLRAFLDQARTDAAEHFAAAAQRLPNPERARQRGLLVLTALESHHLRQSRSALTHDPRPQDIFVAWRAARAAARNG